MVKDKVLKRKSTAIILAIFFGPFSWFYTYRQDKLKLWISISLTIVTLSLWFWVAWIWAFIDAIRRPGDFYRQAGQSFSRKQRIILWSLSAAAVFVLLALSVTAIIIGYNHKLKQQQIVAAEAARLAADPITASGVFGSVNKLRYANGASAQSLESNLTTAAKKMCNDMVTNDYFDYKNPKTGKTANGYLNDNLGNLYVGYYVAILMSGDNTTQTANDVVVSSAKTNTDITDPKYNITGWAVCSPLDNTQVSYIVGMNAEKKEQPAATETKYVPVPTYTPPTYTPPTHCYTRYNDYGGYFNPTATTDCY